MKTLRSLSLVGILGLGLLGSSAYGLETNEKGFPVPDKTKAKIVDREINTYSDGVIEVLYYRSTDDRGAFIEVYGNDNVWLYQVYPDIEKDRFHIIEDRNCDKLFETKYGIDEPKQIIKLPDCYKKIGG